MCELPSFNNVFLIITFVIFLWDICSWTIILLNGKKEHPDKPTTSFIQLVARMSVLSLLNNNPIQRLKLSVVDKMFYIQGMSELPSY